MQHCSINSDSRAILASCLMVDGGMLQTAARCRLLKVPTYWNVIFITQISICIFVYRRIHISTLLHMYLVIYSYFTHQPSHIGIHVLCHTLLAVFNAHMAGDCRFLLSSAPLITPITKGVGGRPASTMGSFACSRLHASGDFRNI